VWIVEEDREKAERLGCTVVDPPSIIATHLTEIIKKYSAEILGRQEVQSILEALKNEYPAVVEEVRKTFAAGEIQKVLQGLLAERVSVRNMVAILETLADYGTVTKEAGFLIEKVRQALGRQICLQYCDEKKVLRVLTIEPSLEKAIIESRLETTRGIVAGLDPALHRRWTTALANAVKAVQEQGHHEIILCSEAARPLVKSSTAREIPHLAVLSSLEVVPDIVVESLGEIRLEG
jgi:flagellar biosynthesis protein FlhA